MKIIIGILFLLRFYDSLGQVACRTKWHADSLDLGRPTPFSVVFEYPVGYDIIFPDSAKGFEPFEVHQIVAFPTRVHGNKAIDSTVYYLNSFLIDSIQSVQFQYFSILKFDTLSHHSAECRIPFRKRVKQWNEKTPYQFENQLLNVSLPINYTKFALIFLLVVGILGMFWKQIQKKLILWHQSYLMEKEWKRVNLELEKFFEQLDNQENFIVKVNSLWKKFIGKHKEIYPESLTSTEMRKWLEDHNEIQIFLDDLLIWCEWEELICFAGKKVEQNEFLQRKNTLIKVLENIHYGRKKEIYQNQNVT